MRTLKFSFISLIVSGCTLHADISPKNNELNNALVGVPYYAQINIVGGNVASLKNSYGDREPVGNISPDDSGLYLKHCNDNKYDNNCIEIRGTPTRTGVIKVRISGFFNVAMFQKTDEFDKTYTINIKGAEGYF
ncbi:hypothetical protein [Erwinia sp. CGal63]|uniref:hypothetical protein n=1 Tax=Erwinia sp. CGal63 TaxID=2919889 RepID=UPI003009D080